MKRIKHVLFALAWVNYIIFSLKFFPSVNIHYLIIAVGLFAATAWLYGKMAAFIAVLIHMPYHAFLTNYYGNIVEFHNEAKVGGYTISLVVVYTANTLRIRYVRLRTLRSKLEQTVLDRTSELHELTKQLIESDENARISLAQDIHDGLGQNLTGLLLYSTALRSALEATDGGNEAVLGLIETLAQSNLNLARQMSRTLFPVKMLEVGLREAILELADYFSHTQNIRFTTRIETDASGLDPQKRIYLYRIAYGVILDGIYHGSPEAIRIYLQEQEKSVSLLVQIEDSKTNDDGVREESMEMSLVRYRASEIGGRLSIGRFGMGSTRIECLV